MWGAEVNKQRSLTSDRLPFGASHSWLLMLGIWSSPEKYCATQGQIHVTSDIFSHPLSGFYCCWCKDVNVEHPLLDLLWIPSPFRSFPSQHSLFSFLLVPASFPDTVPLHRLSCCMECCPHLSPFGYFQIPAETLLPQHCWLNQIPWRFLMSQLPCHSPQLPIYLCLWLFSSYLSSNLDDK